MNTSYIQPFYVPRDPSDLGNPTDGYCVAWIDSAGILHTKTSAGVVNTFQPGDAAPGLTLATDKPGAILYADGGNLNYIPWATPGKVLTPAGLFGFEWVDPSGLLPGRLLPDNPAPGKFLAADGNGTPAWVDAPVAGTGTGGGAQPNGRAIPSGGTAGQVLTISEDGLTLAWFTPSYQAGTTPGEAGPAKLAGLFTGSAPNYNPPLSILADGATDVETAWGPQGSAWYQIDLGAGKTATLTQVRIFPSLEYPQWSRNQIIQGSNDAQTWDVVGNTPPDITLGQWQETNVAAGLPYRYFRLFNNHDFSGFAEVEFYGQ